MRALLTTFAAFFVLAVPASAASTTLVVNEVDYDQVGTDTTEFLEIRNNATTSVNLDPYAVRFVNGANNQIYLNFDLPSVDLAPGGHYVVCGDVAAVTNCNLDIGNASDLIQNGAPDAVAIVQGDTVIDAVSYEGLVPGYSEGTTAPTDTAAGPPAGPESISRVPDGCDTDDNGVDFQRVPSTPGVANGGPACGGPPADAAPTVTDTTPAANANDVALDANAEVTFSEDVAVTPTAFSVSCTSSGTHDVSVTGGPRTYTLDPATDFARGERCTVTVQASQVSDTDGDDPPDTMVSNFTFGFTTIGIEGLRIHDIQGAQHRSPYENRVVSGVPGVVTAASSNGIWVQDPQPDGDDRTSEGIFLFAPSARPPVGTAVTFSGEVQEFKSSSWGPESLSLTEMSRPTVTAGDIVTPIAPTVIGQGGRVPPNRIIDNDSMGDVDTNPIFDPQQDGIDFHESLEGMLLQFDDAVATGPTNNFGEVSILSDNGRNAGLRTRRGGVIVRPFDFNPERFILDDVIGETPDTDTGGRFDSPIVAVADYSFDNFKYYPLADATATSDLQREVTDAPSSKQLAIASFNVENLAPTDPQAKFDGLACTLIDNLKAPDVVAVEEIQDNDGVSGGTASPVVDASDTWNRLIAAIAASPTPERPCAAGPTYAFRDIAPVDDEDGGQPGGNIRQGFLFRTDRGLDFVDRPGGTATNSTAVYRSRGDAHLTFSPGRIDPGNAAFEDSRKPLAGEFTWKHKTIIVVANHFNSKGGDDPLFGHLQPPTRISEVQRHQQATIVNDFARDLQRADPLGNYVVLGDINDFEFSETMQILQGFQMLDLMFTLPPNERYSYVFDGNSQALDHILVSPALLLPLPEYDSVHVNSEFADQQSDHDPQVARLRP
ncbi:MAG TPA: Ig-like domain-containing protein [Solirubrobacteraceae bacterium]|nr:Ig-like domain-containing protein [Solirubrobacteraceae bacterium]